MRVVVALESPSGAMYAKPETPLPWYHRFSVRTADLFVADAKANGKHIKVYPLLGAAGFTLRRDDYATAGELAEVLEAHLEMLGAFDAVDTDRYFVPAQWAQSLIKQYGLRTQYGIGGIIKKETP